MVAAPMGKNPYLNKEESFMYDREVRFKMEDTMNAARIEYTENGVMNMAQRRGDLIRISRSGAVRFLRVLTEKEMNRIFVFSTHPRHKDRTIDLRTW